ncbi:MAG: PIG-L family deacetylase [Planctomycetes bacterium]|nr:PIG-L family deacetylase [Planctomycetota bacterium]
MSDRSRTVRILAIHAHPDDLEFQCAGTLALLGQKGCELTMVTMTPGDCGSAEKSPQAISQIRRNEAQRSAELLHAEYVCLEFRDLSIMHDNQSRQRVTEMIRRARPDLVITAPLLDYMSDHEVTAKLVRDACFNAPIPNYTTQQWDPSAPIEKIPNLYFTDPIEGTDYFGNSIPAEFIVDISSTFELKRQMLACHESQRSWLRKQHGIDEYLDRAERWSAARGTEINAQYGEAFTQYKGHPYPTDNLLLELLKN